VSVAAPRTLGLVFLLSGLAGCGPATPGAVQLTVPCGSRSGSSQCILGFRPRYYDEAEWTITLFGEPEVRPGRSREVTVREVGPARPLINSEDWSCDYAMGPGSILRIGCESGAINIHASRRCGEWLELFVQTTEAPVRHIIISALCRPLADPRPMLR